MAWNRPEDRIGDNGNLVKKSRRIGNFSRCRLSIVLIICIALASIGYMWFSKFNKDNNFLSRVNKNSTTNAVIAPLKPSVNLIAKNRILQGKNQTLNAIKFSGPTNKVKLTKNVKPPTVLGCNYYECVSGGRPLFTKPIFTNSAENIIGGLLSARPGERFLPVELGEDFDNDFVASLKVPILISDDDTSDIATIKEAVSKAKELIAAAVEKGQKPSEFVTSMRDEMNRIADYRDLLQEDFDKLKETASAKKIMAYMKEANILLDEFGAAHLDLPEDEVEEINKRLSENNEKEYDDE